MPRAGLRPFRSYLSFLLLGWVLGPGLIRVLKAKGIVEGCARQSDRFLFLKNTPGYCVEFSVGIEEKRAVRTPVLDSWEGMAPDQGGGGREGEQGKRKESRLGLECRDEGEEGGQGGPYVFGLNIWMNCGCCLPKWGRLGESLVLLLCLRGTTDPDVSF